MLDLKQESHSFRKGRFKERDGNRSDVICWLTGTVIYFKAKEGYGFIKPDDTNYDDILVHHSEIEPWRKGFKTLIGLNHDTNYRGDRVRFGVVKQKDDKLKAVEVQIISNTVNKDI